MEQDTKLGVQIFAIGFAIRCVAAGITTLTTLNPDSTADAIRFGDSAQAIARGMTEWRPYAIPLESIDIYHLWGSFLAPFWLLPGSSGFYGRLGNAFLGAIAIYNVYLIARYYHSHQAGVITSLPMMVYPSFIAVHSTLLREAMVLSMITTVARLLIVTSKRYSYMHAYAVSGIALYIAYILREDNGIIYIVAITSALIVHAVEAGYISKWSVGIAGLFSPFLFILSLPVVRDGVQFLAQTRELRAKGRAVYLPDVIPQSAVELLAFSWIGAAYFLYAPFPWMVETIPDLLISFEWIINIRYTAVALWGVRELGRKNLSATVGLLVGLCVAAILYGVGTANYGTGMRHRQMFLWIIFMFGGIGIAERVTFTWPLH